MENIKKFEICLYICFTLAVLSVLWYYYLLFLYKRKQNSAEIENEESRRDLELNSESNRDLESNSDSRRDFGSNSGN